MRLDINFATAFRLQSLTGVGLKKAETIVQYRQKIGGFDSVDSLCDVPGIGASIVEQNRQVLTCKKLKFQPSRIRHTKSAPSVDVSKLGRRERRGQLATDSTVKNPATAAPGTSNKKSPVTSTRRKRFSDTDVSTRVTRSRIKALPHDDLNSHFTGLIKSTVSSNGSSRHVVDGQNVGTDSQDPVISPVDEDNQSHDLPTKGNNSSSPVESESRNIQERRGRITSHDVSGLPNPTVQPESPADDDDEEEEEEMEREEEEEEEERWMDVNEEGCSDEDEDGERCVRCCCNHVRLTASSHSTHKYHQSKRKSSCKDESYGGKRLCRHPCHSCMSCGHRPSALPPWRHSLCRQRIPSKENPPPGLSTWIDTFKTWSNAERLMALDEMIGVCELTQVRHMMQVIEPQFQRDFISLLPKELALHVLSFLEPRDLLQAAQTCHYWHTLTEDNLLWREKCREENIDRSSFSKRKSATNCSPWKTLYLRQYQIEQNWRSGGIRPNKVLKGHDDHVITCLEYCNNKIISGSDDNTLKVWSAITGKCLRTLVGHTGGVWSSQMVGNTIISGSTDRTLRVWNADTGQCQHVLYGHSSTVRCMSLHVNRVVSGSRDATLRMWDIETGDCLHVLVGHVAAVRCVQYDGRRVVSGAYDYTVRVWDPDTETCVHTLQGHTNRVYSLQFDGAHIVSGSLDTSIRVWDVESGNCLHTLIGHQSLTSGLELKDNILVSGNADSTVKVWDITSGHCLQTLQGPHKHQSAVTCLQFSKKFVITSSDDGTVKIWDLKTGDFLRNLVSLESGGSGGVVWRLRCSNTKLVCAVGSRNGTEETKLLVLDFDVDDKKL